MKSILSAAMVACATLLCSDSAFASSTDDDVLRCSGLTTLAERVQCYDAIAASLKSGTSKPVIASSAEESSTTLSQCVAQLSAKELSLKSTEAALEQAKIEVKQNKDELTVFGLGIGSVGGRGPDDLAGTIPTQVLSRDEYGRPESVQMGIASYAFTADQLLLVVLDNGQVWRQLNGRKVQVLKSDPPKSIKLVRGDLGGFSMFINDSDRSVPATRVDKGKR